VTGDEWPTVPMLPEDTALAWFGPAGGGAVRVRAEAELTIDAEAVAAALYAYAGSPPGDFSGDTAGELVAAELAVSGLGGLYRRAARIAAEEETGTLTAPEWLAVCRQYVSGLACERAEIGGGR
jgi:hypothetical protein